MISCWKFVSIVASFSLALGWLGSASAEMKAIAPSGIYAEIDTRLAKETLQSLSNGTPEQRRKAIEAIIANPENYAPPVLYGLSHALFNEARKDDALFWFYAGQLRARFDANRCLDVSARQAVGVLNQVFGPLINQYAFQDIAKLEELVPKVVEWDQKTPRKYDHRWINLHGMDASIAGMEAKKSSDSQPSLSLPRESWEAVAEKTRSDYLSGFKEAIVTMKNRPK